MFPKHFSKPHLWWGTRAAYILRQGRRPEGEQQLLLEVQIPAGLSTKQTPILQKVALRIKQGQKNVLKPTTDKHHKINQMQQQESRSIKLNRKSIKTNSAVRCEQQNPENRSRTQTILSAFPYLTAAHQKPRRGMHKISRDVHPIATLLHMAFRENLK